MSRQPRTQRPRPKRWTASGTQTSIRLSELQRIPGGAWNRRITALIETGLTFAEAAAWQPAIIGEADIRSIVNPYRDRGIPPMEALQWRLHGATPSVALEWRAAGWSPRNLRALWTAIRDTQPNLDRPDNLRAFDAILDAWRTSPVPPRLAALYIRTGHELAEAEALERRRHRGEDTVPGLEVLDALLNTPTPPRHESRPLTPAWYWHFASPRRARGPNDYKPRAAAIEQHRLDNLELQLLLTVPTELPRSPYRT